MQAIAKVMNANNETVFEIRMEIDPVVLTDVAHAREAAVRQRGAEWTDNAMPYFANDLLQGVAASELVDVRKAVCDMTMTALLSDTVFGGISAGQFLASVVTFTIFEDGRIRYDRIARRDGA